MTIGNNIRKLRIAKNLTQQNVADSLNIDRRTYAAWEQGIQDVKSSFIPRLAEFSMLKYPIYSIMKPTSISNNRLKTAVSIRLSLY